MESKYQTINQKRYLPDGRCLLRIVAKRNFGNIKKGTLGGFIEDTRNLSQSGNCWIGEKAAVFGLARVIDDAIVRGKAIVGDRVVVAGQALVDADAILDQHVYVAGHAHIGRTTYVSGVASILGHSRLYCTAFRSNSGKTRMPNICGLVRIIDAAKLEGPVSVRDQAVIGGDSHIVGRARIMQNAFIGNHAVIEGRVEISGNAHVFQFAKIRDRSVITNNALVGGHADIRGRSLVTGCACIVGQTFLRDEIVSGDYYITTSHGGLEIHPHCPPNRVYPTERSLHAVTPLSTGCH